MTRAKSSGIKLNNHDASIIKGMINRGDRQHDIASWFGVNAGRIGEINTGKTFPDVNPAKEDLPPAGPYLSVKSSQAAHYALMQAKEVIDTALDIIKEYDKSH